MTTDRQIAANRLNAQKSTGPRTGSGKAASAANARRHGLTGALEEASILSWYRVILEDAEAVPNPFEQDPYFRAATDLARAEAHLQRVREAEKQWLLRPALPPTRGEKDLNHHRDMVLDTLLEMALNPSRGFAVPHDLAELFFPCEPPRDDEEEFEAFRSYALNPLNNKGWDPEGFRLLRRTERVIAGLRAKRHALEEKKGRTLARYRASAEARRRSALNTWIHAISTRTKGKARS